RRGVYIHKNSGIPLIGNISFGIVDRGSSLIEVKPITSCILNCNYCSIDEGSESKVTDFIVEADYLIDELKELLDFKKSNGIEIHLNSQGEPLLYSKLAYLVKKIKAIKYVDKISIDTNGLLLTEKKVDELSDAGLDQFNISLNAIDPKIGCVISGSKGYDPKKVIGICKYIQKKASCLLAPILLKGINDNEIPKIIAFAKEIGAKVGIQNFLRYKSGRNPVKQIAWDDFYSLLDKYSKVYDIKLKFDAEDFNIESTKELEKPFKVGDVLETEIICQGRYPNEVIVSASGRNITVISNKKKGRVKFKILRDKHNIFLGKEA
ncbi:radical SAM protein, partial [Pseudomonadota bacterium]